jgi:hypothetical protein
MVTSNGPTARPTGRDSFIRSILGTRPPHRSIAIHGTTADGFSADVFDDPAR